MKRITISLLTLAACISLFLAACSSSKTGGGATTEESPVGEPSTSDQPVSDPVNTYDIPITLIAGEGCPDLVSFFEGLRALPSDAWIRRHTSAFNASQENDDGTRARTNFLSILAFSSFEFYERPMPSFAMELESVEQQGCQSVRMQEPAAGSRDFLIRASTESSLRLGIPTPRPPSATTDLPDATTIEFRWRGPRELEIHSSYMAMDFCPDYKSVAVERTQILRWGPPDFPDSRANEEIDSAYLSRAVKALASVPSGLSTSEIEIAAESQKVVSIPVTELRHLRDSSVRTDMKVCPYRAKPPTGDEPPPPESEGPPAPAETGSDAPPEAEAG